MAGAGSGRPADGIGGVGGQYLGVVAIGLRLGGRPDSSSATNRQGQSFSSASSRSVVARYGSMPRREGASLASVSGTESGKTPTSVSWGPQLTNRTSRQRRRSGRTVVETDLLNAYSGQLAIFGNESDSRDILNGRPTPARVSAGTPFPPHSRQRAVQPMFPPDYRRLL